MQHLYALKKNLFSFLFQNLSLKLIILVSIALFSHNLSFSQNLSDQKAGTQVGYKDSPSYKITGYLVYLPQDYYDDPTKEFPVVVFLHGMGEKGNNLEYLKRTGPPMMINKGTHFPFIMISPQALYEWNDAAPIDQLVEQVKKKLRTDPNRLYTTGLSMGGNGTFNYTFNYAHKIAASVPICGWGTRSIACNAKDVPLWAFHNDGDRTVGVGGTLSMVDALEQCGSKVVKKTIYSSSSHDAWTRTYNDDAMWDWMLSQTKSGVAPPPVNKLPVASAGSDQSITLPDNTLSITGSGSDSDGIIAKYQWAKTSGPNATLTDADKATLKISGLLEGVYNFKLTVTDNSGGSASDEMKVTVNPEPKVNQIPVANAGDDQTITLPENSVTLIGSGTDTDGSIASYHWIKVSGPGAELFNEDDEELDVTNMTEGVYIFKLTITDDEGASDEDEVKVTVNPEPTVENEIPVADAGEDKTLILPENSVTLQGSGTDKDGTVVSYKWTKLDGPAVDMTGTDGQNLQTSNMVEGNYTFKLTVADDKDASASDEVKVTVLAEPTAQNENPVADAGIDQIIKLPINNITLKGSGSDSDGSIVSYSWEKVSGPEADLSATDNSELEISNMVEGLYIFRLTVKDDDNASSSDEVKVTVNGADNNAPIVSVEEDKTITLPENSLTIKGTASDSDGSISNYYWAKISGPAADMSGSDGHDLTVSNMVEGVYHFKLTVKDDKGATASDELVVTVKAAPVARNENPVANAGSDQIIKLPVNSITLIGSGSDSDGSIVSYSWEKISGPDADFPTIDKKELAVSKMVEGLYIFKLAVKDDGNASAYDEVKVTVNAADNNAPTVSVEDDKTLTLPENGTTVKAVASDSDGSISNYYWTKISGPAANLSGADTPELSISNMVEGVYNLKLTVVDDDRATASDEMVITVNAKKTITPVVKTEEQKTITLPENSIRLSATATDEDGTITSYKWTKTDGPSAVLYDTDKRELNVSNMTEGVFIFKVTVTDDDGLRSSAQTIVTVNPAPANKAPIVNAGNDKTITLPKDDITLIGSASDSDGTIVSYEWTKGSGPTLVLGDNKSNKLVLDNLKAGNYVFKLTATDDRGASASDEVKVRVNNPPTANAGYDKQVKLPNNTQLLSGAGSDTDGTIVSYQWTKVSGGSVTMKDASTHLLSLSDLKEGEYTFKLVVKDNSGAAASDEVKVIVNPTDNVAPIANAGGDKKLVLPENSILLEGSGSDEDGKIVSYKWVQTGGNAIEPGDMESEYLLLLNLEEGIYEFKLVVTDDKGATGEDFVKVSVEQIIINTLTLKIEQQDLTCSDDSNGSAEAIVSGGTAPFNYDWSNGASDSKIENLAPGDYNLTVTDASGQVASATVSILAPEKIDIQVSVKDEKSPSEMGSIQVIISGGTAPYQTKWLSGNTALEDGMNISRMDGLKAGSYTIEVTDAVGCTATANYIVNKKKDRKIAVYPNPSEGKFKVAINASEGPYKLTIIDSKGKILHQENGEINANNRAEIREFNLQSAGRGIYFVKVQYQLGVFSLQRIIIK